MNSSEATPLLAKLRVLHEAMRDHLHAKIVAAARSQRYDTLASEAAIQGGDTIYVLDTHAEEILLPYCEEWGRETPFLLVCEGLPDGEQLFGCSERNQAAFIMICDPIDGTRPLMYDKRSAWLITGIAPNVPGANLSHIEIAMQTELPTSRALYADTLWAVRGENAFARTQNLVTGETHDWTPRPSSAPTVEGGYAMFSKFFVGSKGWLANTEEELMRRVLGSPQDGQPQTFDDQYISNAGQLYDLMTGRDRFNAELRPLAHARLHGGASTRLCSHPYDLCGELIARECGVIVTDEKGGPLTAPLDVHSPVSWIAYANKQIQAQIEPALLQLLHE